MKDKKERDKAYIYRSYWEAANKAGLHGEEYELYFDAIFRYMFDGQEIKDTGNPVVDMAFLFIRKLLEANRRNYENALKGGAPIGNQNAKKTTEKQPKNNRNQPINNHRKKQKQPTVTDTVTVTVTDTDTVTDTVTVLKEKYKKEKGLSRDRFKDEPPEGEGWS